MAYVKRRNRLDTCICGVKDGFAVNQKLGHVVNPSTGEALAAGFERRDLPAEQQPRALLNVTSLVNVMRNGEDKAIAFYNMLTKNYGFVAPPPLLTEDIFRYEYSPPEAREAALNASTRTWSTLLGALGVPPNASLIHDHLGQLKDCGTRPMLAHTQLIYNADEVRAALLERGDWWSAFFRNGSTFEEAAPPPAQQQQQQQSNATADAAAAAAPAPFSWMYRSGSFNFL